MRISVCTGSSNECFSPPRDPRENFEAFGSLPEKSSSLLAGSALPLQDCDVSFLFDYDVFPKRIMSHTAQWIAEGRQMRPGDCILQRVYIPPLGRGVCMEFYVRVRDVVLTPVKVGFSYATLTGHVEMGVAEFTFEQRPEGVFFSIRSWSRPAHWLSRLVPTVSELYRDWCTGQALAHVLRRFREMNPSGLGCPAPSCPPD